MGALVLLWIVEASTGQLYTPSLCKACEIIPTLQFVNRKQRRLRQHRKNLQCVLSSCATALLSWRSTGAMGTCTAVCPARLVALEHWWSRTALINELKAGSTGAFKAGSEQAEGQRQGE